MAEAEFVQPLGGDEIIKDLLSQIERRLRYDCNLRGSDAYSGGYDAEVNLKINLHGVQMEHVEVVVRVGEPKDDPQAVKIEEKIEIPLEPNLPEVRERSKQPQQVLAADSEGRPTVRSRSYQKRQPLEPPPMEGGALDAEAEGLTTTADK